MKISDLIRESIRRLLNEEIYGKIATVYHGSQTPPEVFIPLVQKGSFTPGMAAGSMYGPGLYSVFQLKGSKTEKGPDGYGTNIYKLKVNLDGFICLNAYTAQKVYGSPLTIREQLALTRNVHAINRIEEIEEKENKKFLDVPLEDLVRLTSKEAKSSNDRYGFEIARSAGIAYELVTTLDLYKLIPGIVYVGENDGLCVLVYDPNVAVIMGHKQYFENNWTPVDKEGLRQNVTRVSKKGLSSKQIVGDDRSEEERLKSFLKSKRFSNLPQASKDSITQTYFANINKKAKELTDNNPTPAEKKALLDIALDLAHASKFFNNSFFEVLNILYAGSAYDQDIIWSLKSIYKTNNNTDTAYLIFEFLSKKDFDITKEAFLDTFIKELLLDIIQRDGNSPSVLNKGGNYLKVNEGIKYFSKCFKDKVITKNSSGAIFDGYIDPKYRRGYTFENFIEDLAEIHSQSYESFLETIKSEDYHISIQKQIIKEIFEDQFFSRKLFGDTNDNFRGEYRDGIFFKGESGPYKTLTLLNSLSPEDVFLITSFQNEYGDINHLYKVTDSYDKSDPIVVSKNNAESLDARQPFIKMFSNGINPRDFLDDYSYVHQKRFEMKPTQQLKGFDAALKLIYAHEKKDDSVLPGLLINLFERIFYESENLSKCLDYVFTIFFILDENSLSISSNLQRNAAAIIKEKFKDPSEILIDCKNVAVRLFERVYSLEESEEKNNLIEKSKIVLFYLNLWKHFLWWNLDTKKQTGNSLIKSSDIVSALIENAPFEMILKILEYEEDLEKQKIIFNSLRSNPNISFEDLKEQFTQITGNRYRLANVPNKELFPIIIETLFDKADLPATKEEIVSSNYDRDKIEMFTDFLIFPINAKNPEPFYNFIDDILFYIFADLFYNNKIRMRKGRTVGRRLSQRYTGRILARVGVSNQKFTDFYNNYIVDKIGLFPKLNAFLSEEAITLTKKEV